MTIKDRLVFLRDVFAVIGITFLLMVSGAFILDILVMLFKK